MTKINVMTTGYFIGVLGAFFFWAISGFKGEFSEAEEKHSKYNFIVGCLIIFVIVFFIIN